MIDRDDDGRLDRWLADALATIDGDIARERRERTPDFCAVVEAAHARGLVDADALDEAGQLAPIVELGADNDNHAAFEAELDAMISDARSLSEHDIATRRLAGIPPLRSASPEPPARRELGGVVMAVGLAAIIAGLAIAVPRLLEAFVSGNYQEAKPNPNQTEYIYDRDQPEQDLENLRPPPRLIAPEPTPHEAVLQDFPPPPALAATRAEHSKARAAVHERESAPSTDLDDQLATLEAEARAHWQAGELARAEASYRKILAIAGRGRRADLAYGDLFTLAHQRGDAAAELALWQAYLQKFPHGRFAEDAWAGSCRRSDSGARARCWQAYLDEFPHGLHATAATKALAEDPP